MRSLSKRFLVLLLSVTTGAVFAVQAQGAKPQICTDDEAMHALDEADALKDWGGVYRSFKRFARCDDGAIAEGYSDSVGRLLSQDWQHVNALFRFASSDNAFRQFVLRHIDETLNGDTLNAIADNAAPQCPPRRSQLCNLIEARAKDSASSGEAETNVVLGFLEDQPGHFNGQPNFRAVRAVFQKIGDDWKPFRSECLEEACLKTIASEYPAEIAWTITYNGKTLGQVTARIPKEFKFYSDVGLQEIVSNRPVPTVGAQSVQYSGFLGSPVYRPLVAVSQANIQYPQSWKPASLPVELASALRHQFRHQFPTVSNCANPDENVGNPWSYPDDDISIANVYSSNDNWLLVSVALAPWRCDGPEDEGGPFDTHWFVVTPGREIKSLGTGMWFLDAGDYANDGKTEVLFAIARYDLGGYELFYDDFEKHAEFKFAYH
jgi:hypothetical protein